MSDRGSGPAGAGTGPLAGIRVAVTRPAEGGEALLAPLLAAGASARCVPLIRIAAPDDPAVLREAAGRLHTFDWVVLTSANGVAALTAAVRPARLGGPPPPRFAVVGPATAHALEAAGRTADVIAASSVAEGLARALGAAASLAGARVLWPRAAGARPALAAALRSAGAHVEEVEAYVTKPDREAAAELALAVAAGELDVITFTSPSAVRSFSEAGGAIGPTVRVAVIGPVTAAAAEGAGYSVDIQPANASAPRLVGAIVEALGKRS